MYESQNIESKHTDKQYDLLIQQISSLVHDAKRQVARPLQNKSFHLFS